MSKTIDQRVVEMRFDNRHFESNASTTMSTLDKLKEKLSFSGATKGLENVSAAAGKVDMAGLGNGVETVTARFSALEVMGVTALANLTNSAVEAGKRIISALTIDPVKTGFNEYELKMDSVKTIMASTGESVETVNEYLEELNAYSDQTIYSFSDMTQNIGKFTNAGVKLEDAVLAIKGISNEAAVSGANANEASRAMYNFAQALSSGYVKLIDWKSIENANMATVEFKNELLKTALALGTVVKEGDKYQTTTTNAKGQTSEWFNATMGFNDALNAQWMTTDVLVETLGRYADKNTEIGKKAFAAAQDVTKLTQVYDILKETAQSGWAKTWEIIFGDINQAKALFTPLTNFFSNIIQKMSDFRNNLLEGALSFNPFKGLLDKLDKAGFGKIKEVVDGVDAIAHSVEYYQKIVNDVWRGDYKNNPYRKQLLADAGYNYSVVQSLVNLGYKHKITAEEVAEAEKKFGVSISVTAEETENMSRALGKLSDEELRNLGLTDKEIKGFRLLSDKAGDSGVNLSEASKKLEKLSDEELRNLGLTDKEIQGFRLLSEKAGESGVSLSKASNKTDDLSEALENLSDEELKNAGLTDEEIKLFRQLAEEAKKAGVPLSEFAEQMEMVDGRTLLINSFKNAGQGLVAIFKAMKDAWVEIFPPMTSIQLYGIINSLHNFSEHLRVGDETADNLKRTLKGVFAIIDIITTIVGGGFKIAFKVITAILGYFNLDILEATALVGDAVVKFRDWFDSLFDIGGILDVIVPWIVKAAKATGKWFGSLKDSKVFKDVAKWVKNAGVAIKDWFASLKDSDNIPRDIILGLVKGLKGGAGMVFDAIIGIGKGLLTALKDVLGIHSPSTEGAEIGKNIIQGIFNGISDLAGTLFNLVLSVGKKLIEIVKDLDLGSVLTILMGVGSVIGFVKLASALDNVTSPLGELGDTMEAFQGTLKSLSLAIKAEAIKSLAIAIAILAGSVIALSLIDTGKLWISIGAIAALAVILGALIAVMGKFGGSGGGGKGELKQWLNLGKITLALLGLATSILIMAAALKLIASIPEDTIVTTFAIFVGMIAAILMVFGIVAKMGPPLEKMGSSLIALAGALLLMAILAKIAAGMSEDEIIRGAAAIGAFSLIIVGLIWATKLVAGSKNVDKIGGAILSIAGAMLLMVIVSKIASRMYEEDLIKGTLAIAAFGGIIVGLMAATKLVSGSTNVGKIGGAILGVAAAMLLMVIVAKIAASMSVADMAKGILVIAAFGGIIVGLMAATKLVTGSKNMDKIGKTILSLAIAIGLLAIVAAVLSLMSVESLVKGVTVVAVLAAIMAGLMFTAKYAKDSMGAVIAITAAIAVLAISVGVLSLLDPVSLIAPTLAMAALMAMFALILKAGSNVQTSWSVVLSMAAVIAVMAGALYLLAQLPVENALSSAGALSMLVAVLAVVILAFSKLNVNIANALLGVISLTLMAVPLLAFVGVLALMQGVNNALSNAAALTLLATAMTVLLIPLTLIGSLVAQALLGVVALTLMAVPLLAFVGVLALMQGIEDAEANANLLIKLMTVMTAMLLVTGLVAPLALAGVAAMAALTGLIVAIGALVVGIGALMTKFPQLQEFMDVGIPILEQLAHAIGSVIGNLIAGFSEAIASSLPVIGACLSQFMLNAMPFITGIKMVDASVLAGVGALAGAILALTAVDLISGVMSFIKGGSSFASLGTELSMFMMNAMPFILGASLLTAEMVGGVKALAETILILTAADVLNGLTSWLTGGSSLSDFAAQLPILGTGLRGFLDALGTFSDSEVTTVTCAANAVKALASVASEIPNTGGLLAQIVGDNQIGPFAEQFPTLGTGLRGFLDNIGTFTDTEISTVKCAAEAVKTLASAASEIPNSGGWAGAIIGDNDLGAFAEDFPKLATGLKDFVANIGETFTPEQAATVNCAADCVKALAAAAANIPNSGGWVGAIVGNNDLGTFGDQFPKLGEGLKGFIDKIGTFSTDQLATVKTAILAIDAISALAKKDVSAMKDLGKNISDFGGKLGSFCTKMTEIGSDKLTTAVTNVMRLSRMMDDLSNVDTSAAKTFSDSLKTLGKSSINSFVKAFSGDSAISSVKSAVKTLITAASDAVDGYKNKIKEAFENCVHKAITGVKNERTPVKKAFATLTEAAVDRIEDEYDDFKDAGKYLGKGFEKGIKAKLKAVKAAAAELAEAAAAALEAAAQIKSPSKITLADGKFFGEGFVLGIEKYASSSYEAGLGIADSAKKGLNNSINKIQNYLAGDIDMQPTIRPVMDLSDVKTGINAIGGLFGEPSLAVAANVGAISSAMRERSQNGVNDEIVSAINKLRKDVGSMDRNTYNFNGFTYEENSDVAGAIRTLTRAARIERRT